MTFAARLLEVLRPPVVGLRFVDRFKVRVSSTLYLLLRVALTPWPKRIRAKFLEKAGIFRNTVIFNIFGVVDGQTVFCRARQPDHHVMSRSYETEIVELLERELSPNSIVVDVGANVGKYVLIAGRIILPQFGGYVVGIEPEPSAYRALLENCKLNGLEAVFCLNEAVLDHTGQVCLRVPNWTIWSTAGSQEHNGGVWVNTDTLDNIVLRRLKLRSIDWLLIDVEGSGIEVLREGIGTLQLTRNVVVETHSGACLAYTREILAHAGFTLWEEKIWAHIDPTLLHVIGHKGPLSRII